MSDSFVKQSENQDSIDPEVYQKECDRFRKDITDLRNNHPELLKYLDEMVEPGINDKHPEIVLRDLRHYHQTLVELVRRYENEKR